MITTACDRNRENTCDFRTGVDNPLAPANNSGVIATAVLDQEDLSFKSSRSSFAVWSSVEDREQRFTTYEYNALRYAKWLNMIESFVKWGLTLDLANIRIDCLYGSTTSDQNRWFDKTLFYQDKAKSSPSHERLCAALFTESSEETPITMIG